MLDVYIFNKEKSSDDMSCAFRRDIITPEQKLTNFKTTNVNYPVRHFLRDTFGFAGNQKMLLFV